MLSTFNTHHIGRMVRWGWRSLLDVFLPPRCMACQIPVQEHGALCPQCWQGMEFITRPYCEHLGTPFTVDIGQGMLSARAMAAPMIMNRIRAVARYEGTARTLVHRLKFHDHLELVQPMAALMQRAGTELLQDADILVPVPLHTFRLWKRRFNQSAELVRALGQETGIVARPVALRRKKATRSQVGLTRKQRRDNLRQAFCVRLNELSYVKGKRIVLVDDVMTTGATLNAAAQALLDAGALRVDALTFALVFDRV